MESNQYAERLEEIREELGLSLRAWWQKLTEGDDFEVSYESVRQYHQDREPSVSYLNRVSKRFGVSLQWLMIGEGSIWLEPSDALVGSAEGVRDAAADLFIFGPSAYVELTALLFAIQEASSVTPEDPDELTEGAFQVASMINDWSLAPLVALSPEGLTRNQKSAFFKLLMTAIQMLVPSPGEGNSLDEIADHWKQVIGRRFTEGED